MGTCTHWLPVVWGTFLVSRVGERWEVIPETDGYSTVVVVDQLLGYMMVIAEKLQEKEGEN